MKFGIKVDCEHAYKFLMNTVLTANSFKHGSGVDLSKKYQYQWESVQVEVMHERK